MRPLAIMASAVVLAALIAAFAIYLTIFSGPSHRILRQNATAIENPGGLSVANTDNPARSPWAIQCIALLTAPRSMQVNDTAEVVTMLLTGFGDAGAYLLKAGQQAAELINHSARASDHDPQTGLDPAAADAIRRLIADNGVRQAAVDTLPGAPVLTAHLTGPGFRMTPETPNPQPLIAKNATTWRWAIKAIDPGSQILTMSYEVETKVAGQKVPQSLRTITREITVSVAPGGILKEFADQSSSAKTIAENLSWIWTTMIFPAGMFLYGLLKLFRGRHA